MEEVQQTFTNRIGSLNSERYELLGEAFASKADVTTAQREQYTILDSDDVEDPSQRCPQLQQY